MDDQAATEKLAEALPYDRGCLWIRSDIDAPCTCLTARRQAAAAQLPVVRKIAADELEQSRVSFGGQPGLGQDGAAGDG